MENVYPIVAWLRLDIWQRFLMGVIWAQIALIGCGASPDAFMVSYPDNRDRDVEVLLARLNQAPPRNELSVAVGVTTPPLKLYAFDLNSKRLLWQQPTATITTPVVAGNAVITRERERVLVRDLPSGALRATIDTEQQVLIGADADDRVVILTFAKGNGQYADSRVVAIAGSDVVWQREFKGMAGAPAVVGDVVLVPWNHQNLSALDRNSGREFARIRVRDAVVGRVFANRGSVYAGSQYGVVRLTKAIRSGWAKKASYFAPPEKKLPGQPMLLQDAYSPTPVPLLKSGQNHVRLSWLPAVIDEQNIGLQDKNLYLVFYKFVVAFDPATYNVYWINTNPVDITGAATVPGGIVFADEEGEVSFIAAKNGQKLWNAASGLASQVIEVRTAESPVDGSGVTPLKPEELRDQLLVAAQHDDDRLAPVRLLLVELLAKLPEAEATGALIELCDKTVNTPLVRKNACEALEKREQGADYVLAALQRHAGFLASTLPPPVGPLAKAAARQKDPRAVAPLLAHLRDPQTPSEDLVALVQALAILQDRSALRPLEDFIRLYHADPVDPNMIDAVNAALSATLSLGGPAEGEFYSRVANDELAVSAVRARALMLLDELDRARQLAEQKEQQQQQQQQQTAEAGKKAASPKQSTPERLSLPLVDAALLPVKKKLKACLKTGGTQLFSARIMLVVEEGKVETVAITPQKLQSCIEPLVRSQTFPITDTHKKEQIFYTLSVR